MNKKKLEWLVTDTACWEVTSHKPNTEGYCSIKINYKKHKLHRLSWIQNYGKIPTGLCVCHICDNTKCINPEHLFLGNRNDNNQDKIKKGRFPSRKLTLKQVKTIRNLYKTGNYFHYQLADRFNVSRAAITNVVNRTSYCEVY